MNLDDSNQDNPKIPSAINFTLQASGGGPAWGNDAKGVEGSLEWFKLLLVDEDDLPDEIRRSEHVQKARACLRVLDRMPEEVISDYLRGVWKRCLEKMKTEVSQTTVDNSRFHVVITLPAICKCFDSTKLNTTPISRACALNTSTRHLWLIEIPIFFFFFYRSVNFLTVKYNQGLTMLDSACVRLSWTPESSTRALVLATRC